MSAAEQTCGEYSPAEELANVITHFMGLLFGIAALVVLLVLAARQNDPYAVVGVSIFGATVIMLYSASVMYHAMRTQRAKQICKLIDHVAIYLLIAGTYTFFTLSTALRGPWGWSLFGVVWGLAAMGIALELIFRDRFKVLSVVLYLLMGWLVVITLPAMINTFPRAGLVWLFAGGLSYSIGVIFYAVKRIPFNHALWHLFVLGGSASHLVAAYYCL